MTTDYTLVYPTQNVGLGRLARAALKLAGSLNVTVVSGAGSQALRVPQDAAPRIYEEAGLAPDGTEIPPPPETKDDLRDPPPPPSSEPASGPEEESPGPDAPTIRPAARPGGRAGRRMAAKKATSSRSTSAQTKEGDDA